VTRSEQDIYTRFVDLEDALAVERDRLIEAEREIERLRAASRELVKVRYEATERLETMIAEVRELARELDHSSMTGTARRFLARDLRAIADRGGKAK